MSTLTPSEASSANPPIDRRRRADLAAAFAGAVAGASGIAAAELLAGLIPGAPSLVVALGDLLIRFQPPGAKNIAVDLFGVNDKLVLTVVIVLVALAMAAGIGVIGRRSWRAALGGFAVLAALLGVATLTEPLVPPVLAVLALVLALVVAVRVLRMLLAMLEPVAAAPGLSRAPATAVSVSTARPPRTAQMPDWNRRRFLLTSGSFAVGSIAAGAVGRILLNRQPEVPTAAAPVPLPSASALLSQVPVPASLAIAGITPIVMPNDRFYRIDTALIVPRVDVKTWKLTVKGLVNRETTFTYDQLKALGLFEQYVTIACVSNRVGQDLVGNAKWTGVHLRDVLAAAGVRPEASQIVGRSVDGFTAGFPTEWAMDPSRDPMVAIGMNDELLPAEHGYPARLIIPGLFGYVSATKWLAEIELTTLDEFDGYWIPLGWSKLGPILTQSRIDVPRNNAQVPAGLVGMGGVAWAPDRGIVRVEVRVDEGAWQPATLSAAISKATWVQWQFDWMASAGAHRLEVRATDGKGEVQTDLVTPPAPDGARGHHHVTVNVG